MEPAEPTFTIKQNDRRKYLKVTAYDSTGAVIDLTGMTAVFNMWFKDGHTIKVSRAAVDITDPTNGEMEYRWAADDTDTVGEFEGEFETLDGSGVPWTFPDSSDNPYIKITVIDDIA